MLSFKKTPVSVPQVNEFVSKCGYMVQLPLNMPTLIKGFKVVYLIEIAGKTQTARYFGCTANLKQRINAHLCKAKWVNTANKTLSKFLLANANYKAGHMALINIFGPGAKYTTPNAGTPTLIKVSVVGIYSNKVAQAKEKELITNLFNNAWHSNVVILNTRIGGAKGKPEVRKKKVSGYKKVTNTPFIALNTKTGGKTVWHSTVACAAGLGLNQGNISNALKGNFKKVKHYKFFYLKNQSNKTNFAYFHQ